MIVEVMQGVYISESYLSIATDHSNMGERTFDLAHLLSSQLPRSKTQRKTEVNFPKMVRKERIV